MPTGVGSKVRLTQNELVMPAKTHSPIVIQHYLDTMIYIALSSSVDEFLVNNLKLMMQLINWNFTNNSMVTKDMRKAAAF